ncbi:MAG: anti-sigma factor [Pseudomonadota bacterium]|nr:anti-sigma factor [Pseudomonadota bacterium]
MSTPDTQGQVDDATIDLLIKQVTEGLSPAEQRALDVLDGAVASGLLRDLERAAAAVTLAGSANAQTLPPAMAQRLARQAEQHFAVSASRAALRAGAATAAEPRRSNTATYGWLAAAACLVLALFSWMRGPPPGAPVAQVVPPAVIVAPTAKPSVPPTMAEERAALMAKNDTLKITLAPSKDPAAAGVSGDVVWDSATQRGYLHFAGLAANDPTIRQYQLWIFDGGRDKRYPVDGGVFDVPANADEVVIPIRAALMVRKPAAFAVTIEKPGGVVVSGREHVVVLGAAG